MVDLYRQHLTDAINGLIEVEQILFTGALNIAWSGELSHLEDAYEADDEMTFDLSLLKSVEDLNVKKIVDFLTPLQQATEYLKNVNGITDEELGWEEDNQ